MTYNGFHDYEIYLFHEGNLLRSYRLLGSHVCESAGQRGVRFGVWAPRAKSVRLVGDFNGWNGRNHELQRLNMAGIWMTFVPGLAAGCIYKYEIHTEEGIVLKADPYAFFSEVRPHTASIVYDLATYQWGDKEWQKKKSNTANGFLNRPVNIYEMHMGSWKRKDNGTFYTYRELARELIPYVNDLGYTHIECMPLSEHPYDRSWGYQITGFFSVTSRYGDPCDFMYFVDQCHQAGLGVILDWVPGHFAKDAHGLRRFDGSPQYESADSRKAEKTDWGTLGFDYGKPEVVSFLLSNALFWLDQYHIDGLRVDAVSSMLYLDFSKQEGEWTPNAYGGREHLEAISFLKKLNAVIRQEYPDTLVMAEESTACLPVTGDVAAGGLGFPLKWNMGWMNDTLRYFEIDPLYRNDQHDLLTFSIVYAFSERFLLPLSHDEVVHGKRSLIDKMPGDYWEKFSNLRLLLGYQMTHPGKKLLFMGGEFGQFEEWNEDEQLKWSLLDFEQHRQLFSYVRDLNYLYRKQTSLWQLDHTASGFEWIDPHDRNQSVITYMRKGKVAKEFLIIICNFTPILYPQYRIGVPKSGAYEEVFNSDKHIYGGSGQVNRGCIQSEGIPWHNRKKSIHICLPPLAMVVLKKSARGGKGTTI
ncbi:1,4-alpha-glucan branching protein GlgB [Fodinisporobacter ferrooxydans]|uniref:1,4-alpha-glucan branching enzyme GlgB n=1 Tax=Fodinisporobacter ferrooxydans TaxID=2901836 RepID=A0ABY4CGT4_9BACL|nr:1,4-alpha-glucan branching protein GlgB [Alicyclobacillaceae bacterium MYW30-H2]